MAPSAKYLSFFFLIFFPNSLTQVHARESKFFSKFNFHQHISTPTTTSSNKANTKVVPFGGEEEPRFTTPTKVVQLSPSSAPAYPPDTYANSPTPANAPDIYAEAPTPSYVPEAGESYGSKEFEMEFSEDNFNNNNNNEGKTKKLGLGETRLIGNDEMKNNYNGNYGEMNKEELRNNLIGRKQQGMSDTRFVENGRYFYNLDKETYPINKYRPTERTGHTSNTIDDGEYKTQQFDLGGATLQETREDNNYEGSDNLVSENRPQREKQGMSDTRFMENGRYFYNLNMEANQHNQYQPRESIANDGEHKAQQFDVVDAILRENGDDKDDDEENMDNVVDKNQAQQMERKGMSETRFLENGRYFYDLSNEHYNTNGGKPVGEDQGVFGSTRGMELRNEENEGNYYVNNADEFDNSEEEYRYQEGNPEEYQP